MKSFFIDTADDVYIRQAWTKLSEHFVPAELAGITTNPNAMAKVGANSLSDWERVTRKLCETMDEIRPAGGGVVYVQAPVSTMTQTELLRWATKISRWCSGVTRIGMKIPPFKKALEIARDLYQKDVEVNVTGVADVATALLATSYSVHYVSVIPGRMEERGIDAKAQVGYLMQSNPRAKIIAGSMRTKEGLKWVTEYGTVPTVGTRVLDLYFADSSVAEFASYWDHQQISDLNFSPTISGEQTKLSVEFFEQMDGLGAPVYKEFA